MKTNPFLLVAASMALAIAFTFSCTADGGEGGRFGGLDNPSSDSINNTPSSNSGGDLPPPTSSSSGTPNANAVAFCDFRLPNSSGGGCFPIYSMEALSECDTRYATLETKCGTSGIYCRWQSGCWEVASNSACTGDYGIVVSECSPDEYGLEQGTTIFYCLNPNASTGTTCTRIKTGGTYTGAKACINSVGAKAAVIARSLCEDLNAIIIN